ncbi:MAG: ABC transporter permease [Chitinophagaceae bacterium]|nr:ABC transporter permease [Chitinophagaceae bacterium]
MFKSYLRTAYITITRNKFSSFIHIFGLGLAMTLGLMIMIRMQDDLSWDQFHPRSNLIYRITTETSSPGGEHWKMASTPVPLHAGLLENNNDVVTAVNIYPAIHGRITTQGKEFDLDAAYTDPSFFTLFGFRPMAGNINTALVQPNSIVLSQATAEKFFGQEDPLGKLISLENGQSFTVTAVLKSPPGKTHINFDAYASISSLTASNPVELSNWFAFQAGYNYVLLRNENSAASLQQYLNSTADQLNRQQSGMKVSFHLQPFNEITPSKIELANELGGGPSWAKIMTECGITLLILIAACFNYTNLTIARALKRAREIGIRKIIGASRLHVFLQCIAEAILLSLISLLFAWIVLSFVIRYAPFNDGYEFIPSTFHYNPAIISYSLAFALFTGLLAGASPAWILSAFTPLKVLRNFASMKIMGRAGLQKTLIVFQYSLSLVMIIFLSTFYRQFNYLSKLDAGFRTKDIVALSINGANSGVLQKELNAVSGIREMAVSSADPGNVFHGQTGSAWLGNRQSSFQLKYIFSDEHFLPMMQLRLLSGNNFNATGNSSPEHSIIINQQAARAMGFQNTGDAIGQLLHVNDSLRLTVIGLIKDVHMEGTGRAITPMAIRFQPSLASTIFATIDPQADRKQMEARLEAVWKQAGAKGQPFRFSWLDEEQRKRYSQSATISLLAYLSFIAIVIATLGLLGVVVHTIESRRKEITIRKIIGAEREQLIRILSSGFMKLLLLSGLIAMPVGYILGSMFLFNFPERVGFGAFNVITCFCFLLGIGLLTIIPHTWAAASKDPVDGLRAD